MKKACALLAAVIMTVSVGCNHGGGEAPSDYARIVIRNDSDTEAATIEVSNEAGEVVISELLEPNSTANARSAPGSHSATATVAGADGSDGASYSESFDVAVLAFVTYKSASEDAEAGLTVNAPGAGDDGADGEDGTDGEDGADGEDGTNVE